MSAELEPLPVAEAIGDEVAVREVDPFEPLAAVWLEQYPENTRAAYEADLGRWRTFLAERGKGLFTADRVDFIEFCQWAKTLRKNNGQPFAQTTRARWESSITSLYDFFGEMDRSGQYRPIGHPKGAKLRTRPGEPQAPTPALSAEQLKDMLEAAMQTDAEMYLVCLLLYITAARVSELTGMSVRDVRREAGTVRIGVTIKGDKRDEAYLDGPTGEMILQLIVGRGEDEPLVPRANGGRMTREYAASVVKRAGRLIDMHVTPHVLRTTAINVAIDKRGLHAGQQLARHRRVSTTEIYFRRLERHTEGAIVSALLGAHIPHPSTSASDPQDDSSPAGEGP